MSTLSRRHFLSVSVSALGGLVVGVRLEREPSGRDASVALSSLIRIEPSGEIAIVCAIPEIGQGVRTSLSMLVADALDAAWERIVVEQGGASDLGVPAVAAGSYSIRGSWEALRLAGAVARDQLLRAAATRWGVSTDACSTREGVITHEPSGRTLSYADVALEASRLIPREGIEAPPLQRGSLVGRAMRSVDVPDIVAGRRAYGIDVRRPGQRFAVIARAPVVGGRLVSVDESRALAFPGVQQVLRVEPYGSGAVPTVSAGVAVVATNTWAAIRGRALLNTQWDDGVFVNQSTADYRERAISALDQREDDTYLARGDVGNVPADAVRVRGRYHLPFLAHATMEPPVCTVEVRGDSCEIWAPTQIPASSKAAAARFLGWDEQRITLHVTGIGGGFGRRLDVDFILEAVAVARQVQGPVMVTWTREDDLQHGFFRPYAWHDIEAAIDESGTLLSWHHRQAGTSRYATRAGRHPGQSEFLAGTWPAAFASSFRLGYSVVDAPFDRGPLRAPGNNGLVFAIESFLDEIATSRGMDPLAFRLELLGADRQLPYDDEDPVFDTARMRAVLQRVAAASEWNRQRPTGLGLGIAGAYVFGSYTAHVVEVAVDQSTGGVSCKRAWSAIDCGQVVNPLGVRAQVEGGLIDGLSAALNGEITIRNGRVQQRNFNNYRLMRLPEAPSVDVHIIESSALPTGAGEPPYPPALPALANAIAAASGARVRELPITPARILAALRR